MKRNPQSSAALKRKLISLAVASCFVAEWACANPTAPIIVNGSASILRSGNLLQITNSPNAIINWGSFSIGASEITRFIQQSQASAVLNRVVGQNPSTILGALQSNGRVFLLNPSGILFGAGAQIDVAGLVASTLNLSNVDFLAGRLRFTDVPGAGSIVNQGNITTAQGGNVYLVAPDITNSGIITSPKGEVVLAAGKSVELVEPGTPNLRVEITASDNEARNLGHIVADSGRVGIYAGLINHSGTIRADSAVVGESGRILLKATRNATLDAASVTSASGPSGGNIEIQSGDTTLVSGTVEAKGIPSPLTGEGQGGGGTSADGVVEGKGGTVHILGTRVGLIDNARIDASGQTGGGKVLVGGDYRGENPSIRNAQITYVGTDASIRADATANGDGGKVIVWADDTTRAYGAISARGVAQGGNGGFVETSGKRYLDVTRAPDISAPAGTGGIWLLDPETIDIAAASNNNITASSPFTPVAAGTSTLNVTTLNGALDVGGTVIVDTTGGGSGVGDINVNAAVSKTSGPNATLRLNAHNDININQSITSSTGQLNMVLNPDQDAAGGGVINLAGVTLDANGGTISAAGKTLTINPGVTATINSATTAGTINLTNLGTLSSGASLTTNTLIWNASGTISGTGALNVNTTLGMGGAGTTHILSGGVTVNNLGTATLAGNGTLRTDTGGSTINNRIGATFTISDNSNITNNTGTGTFNNEGTFTKSGGGGTTTVDSNFNNTGRVNANNGVLSVSGALAQSGVIEVASGATFRKTGGFTNTGTLRGAGTIDVGAGNGLTNSGIIAPGIPSGDRTGTLSITGNLANSASGTIAVDMEGILPGQFDVVSVSGNTTLSGTLSATPIAGYTPLITDQFQFLTCGGGPSCLTGTFGTVSAFGATVNSIYNPSDFLMTFASVLPINDWNTDSSGDWSNAGLWSLGVPIAGQAVRIDRPSASPVITVSGGSQIAGQLLANEILNITGGSLDLGGDSMVNSTLALSGGTLTGAGNLTVNNTFSWSGTSTLSGSGAFNTPSSTTSSISGTTLSKTLSARTWNNGGFVNWASGRIFLNGASATINNQPGALFASTAPVNDFMFFSGASGTFNNQAGATFRKSGGAGGNVLTNFTNSGLLDLRVFQIFNVSLTNSGTVDTLTGGGLRLNGGTTNFNAGTTLTGTGILLIESGVTVNVNTPLNIPSTMTFNLQGGTVQGSADITVNGPMADWNFATVQGSGQFNTHGVSTLTPNGQTLRGSRVWNNFGTINMGTSGGIVLNDTAVLNIQPGGVLNMPSFSGQIIFITGSNLLTNGGTISVGSGATLSLNGSSSNFPVNNGIINLQGGTFNSGGLSFTNGATGIISGTGTVDLFTGTLTNNGTIAPGASPGTLSVNGNLALGASSVLNVELAGTGAGQFDVLAVSGTANLAGTLNVSYLSGYIPAVGANHPVLTYASQSGTFTTINDAQAQTPTYGATSFVLTGTSGGGPVAWDGGAGDFLWTSLLNWSADALPISTQDVTIGVLGTPVTLSSGAQSVKSLVSNAGLIVSGGSLTLAQASTINATLTVSGGTVTANGGLTANGLSVSSGTLTGLNNLVVNNSFSHSGGTISGFGLLDITQSSGNLTFGSPLNIQALTGTASAGNLNVNASITASGNVTLHADAAGGLIAQAPSSVIQANTLTATAHSGVTLSGQNQAASFNATNTTANGIQFTDAAGMPLTVTGISQSGGNVVVTADDLNITGAINAGANTVTLRPTTLSQNINIESAPTGGVMSLTPTEIQNVTAGTLEIGRSDGTGNLTLVTGTDLADSNVNAGTLKLYGNDININGNIGASGFELGKHLEMRAKGDLTLGGANNVLLADNKNLTLVADNDLSGAGELFASTMQNMIVGTTSGNTGSMTLQGQGVFLYGSQAPSLIRVTGSGTQTITSASFLSIMADGALGNIEVSSGGGQTISAKYVEVLANGAGGASITNVTSGTQSITTSGQNASGEGLVVKNSGSATFGAAIDNQGSGSQVITVTNADYFRVLGNAGAAYVQSAAGQTISVTGAGLNSIEVGQAGGLGLSHIFGASQSITAGTGSQFGSITLVGSATDGIPGHVQINNTSGAQTISTTGLLSITGGTSTGPSGATAQLTDVGTTQSITAGGISLTGGSGAGVTGGFAQITGGNTSQDITVGSGGISITGGSGTGGGNSAAIGGVNQTIVVNGGNISVLGGTGTVTNNAEISSAGTPQTITVNDAASVSVIAQTSPASIRTTNLLVPPGDQTLTIEGALSANALTVGSAASANSSTISGGNQSVTAGMPSQSGSITILGGTAAGKKASISNGNGTQTVSTTGTLALTGGVSTGGTSGCGPTTGGACADITSSGAGLQHVTANKIDIKGGDIGGSTGSFGGAGIFVNAGNMLLDVGAGGLSMQAGDGAVAGNNFAQIGGSGAAGRTLTLNVTGNTTVTGGTTDQSNAFIGLTGTGNLQAITVNLNGTGDVTLTGGSSTNTGAVIGTGGNQTNATSTLTVSGKDITLNPGSTGEARIGHNSAAPGPGDVSVTATGDIALNGAGAVASAIRTTGNVTLQATGTGGQITQGTTAVISAATLTASSNSAVSLPGANDFTQVAVPSAGSVTLNDVNAITLNGVTSSGALSVTAGGAITQTAPLAVGGTSSFSAGANPITLTDSGNDFTGAVSLNNSGANDVAITDANALTLGAMAVGSGTLTVNSSGALTQTGAITQAAGAGAATFNSGAGALALTDPGNILAGALSLSGSSVSISGANALTLGAINTSGLTVNAVGISQSAPLTVSGTATFNAGAGPISLTEANDFGTVVLSNSGANNISVTDVNALVLGGVTTSGTLTVNTGGAVTQSAPIAVAGASIFNAGANSIALTDSANSFVGAVSFTNSGANDVSITNAGTLNLGAASVGGSFSASAAGAASDLNLLGASTVGGSATLSGGRDVMLGAGLNVFGNLALSAGNQVRVNDAAVSAFGTLSVSGAALDVTATSAPSTLEGEGGLAVTANSVTVQGGGAPSASAELRGGPGAFNVATTGGITVFGGSGAGAFSRIFGDPDVNLVVGGVINMTSGSGAGAFAAIESASPTSINVTFPNLAGGGYFVNGVEGSVFDSASNSGFVAGGLPALLGQNLNVSYGVASSVSAAVLSPLLSAQIVGTQEATQTTTQIAEATAEATEEETQASVAGQTETTTQTPARLLICR